MTDEQKLNTVSYILEHLSSVVLDECKKNDFLNIYLKLETKDDYTGLKKTTIFEEHNLYP